MDSTTVECLRNGGDSIIEWLLKLFKRCMEIANVSEGWKVTCIIPVYSLP